MSIELGFAAEEQARHYLTSQGLKWVCSNYRCRLGEIDLILRDADYLVFTEVRARNSRAFGGALASVTNSKQRKLLKTAEYYLQAHRIYDNQPCRFDVVSIEGIPPRITWIKNAFQK